MAKKTVTEGTLIDLKNEILTHAKKRDERKTVAAVIKFFAAAQAMTNDGILELMRTADANEDTQLLEKIAQDSIVQWKQSGGKPFPVGAANPG